MKFLFLTVVFCQCVAHFALHVRQGAQFETLQQAQVYSNAKAEQPPAQTESQCRLNNLDNVQPQNNKLDKIYLYGDSNSDTYRTFQIFEQSYPPYPLYDQRFSNGPVWLMYVAEKLNAEIISLAIGGATTDSQMIEGITGIYADTPVAGIKQQVSMVVDNLSCTRYNGIASAQALHIISGGANDMIGYIERDLLDFIINHKKIAFIIGDSLLNTTRYLVEKLEEYSYKEFGKSAEAKIMTSHTNFHAMPCIVKLGELAVQIALQMRTIVSAHLSAGVAQLQAELHERNSSIILEYFPVVEYLDQVILRDYADYGFTFNDVACLSFVEDSRVDATVCNDVESYVFWDDIHGTTKVHEIVSNLILDNSPILSSAKRIQN